MPVRKDDAHRALELLEDYHTRLTKPQDRPLKTAIERVIRIFKSRLFQALLDIQDFYESTLLDETKSSREKTLETLRVASKWEREQPFTYSRARAERSNAVDEEDLPPPPPEISPPRSVSAPLTQERPRPVSAPVTQERPLLVKSLSSTSHLNEKRLLSREPEGLEAADAELGNIDNDGDWVYEEIVLDRGNGGLGFSIAGGADHPPVGGECCLFITKLIQGGAAADDGRLQLNDVILRVNNIDVSKATHATAVDVLKRAGKNVVLFVKRRKYHADKMLNIKLIKGSMGLGISISGGKDNQHVPGDNGIFISKIIEGGAAHRDGRLSVMDRLIAVNDQNLEGVTHEQAVLALKNAHDTVRLTIAKPSYHNQPAGKLRDAVKSQTKQDIEPTKGKAENAAVDG